MHSGYWIDRRIYTSENHLEFNKITEGVIIGDDLTQTTSTPISIYSRPLRRLWHQMEFERTHTQKKPETGTCYIQSECYIVFDGIDLYHSPWMEDISDGRLLMR